MTVKILTEAGLKIGYGHFFRCLSLYDELVTRGVETQMLLYGDSFDDELINNRKIINQDWINDTNFYNKISKEDYVIIDSYKVDSKRLQEISENAKKVLYIDDTNRLNYPKGIIVNPSLSGEYISYPDQDGQTLLTGMNYIILRDAFLNLEKNSSSNHYNRALVMLGGTDIDNLTESIIEEVCLQNTKLSYDVIVPQNKIEYFKKKYTTENISFFTNLSADEMATLMSGIDFAITGAGQTIFELIYLEIPFVTIQVVDNQKYNVRAVKEFLMDEMVLQSNDPDFLDKLNQRVKFLIMDENRVILSRQINNLIDGLGSKRIIDELLIENIIIREAKSIDMKAIYELSNQQYVRQYSINKKKIKWEDHVNWYKKILDDSDIKFYIVTNESDEVLGQVRFNLDEDYNAIVSISLSEIIKGKGYSKKILTECLDLYFQENDKSTDVIAYISEKNQASLKLFKGIGFEILSVEKELLKLILKEEGFNVN